LQRFSAVIVKKSEKIAVFIKKSFDKLGNL